MLTRLLNATAIFILLAMCYLIARSGVLLKKDENKQRKLMWERERKANSVRRQDISKLPYIFLDMTLPFAILKEIGEAGLLDSLMAFAEKKCLNLSEYTNTDLKLMYGPANLPELSTCDENFSSLTLLLHKAGKALYEAADMDEKYLAPAREILEYAIDIGSERSETYRLLGELYLTANDSDAFSELKKKASHIKSSSKSIILSKLKSLE